MMDNEVIVTLLKQQHSGMVELMNANKTAINAETKASASLLEEKMNHVIARQDIANGKTAKLEESCKDTLFFKKTFRWKIMVAIGLSVLLSYVCYEVGIFEILKLVK